MLLELRIENLLLIERAELRLGSGLNAITGETGAGKTILAHSFDLLMGGKARAQIVRPGAGEAYVEGVFELPGGLLDDPELSEIAERLPEGATEVAIGRRVSASGRTSAFIAGRSASAPELQALGSRLLAFYGQHEHRKLTLSGAQLETLDGFAGEEHLERRRGYREAHSEVIAIERELALIREREGARVRDLDILRYELEEIEVAKPDPAEEAELAPERERLRHAEALRGAASEALEALAGEDGGGASEAMGSAEAALAAQQGVDAHLDKLGETAMGLRVELQELAGELRGYAEGIEAEPGRLEQVEERLDVLDRLKRKHGGSIESVLAHAEHCRAEIETIEGAGERTDRLEADLTKAQRTRTDLAAQLSEVRAKSARALEKRVAAELDQLAMGGAKLEVALEPHPEGFGALGQERVTFRVATNPGMPVSPLRDAASGGELSRVMLALAGQGARGGAATYVFDEIDAGIGGNTANAVGERLRALGTERQVLCITHLPQVASMAQGHFRIEKSVDGGQAIARVERVDGEGLVAEIVRMLGGDDGDEAADRHARQLLKAA
ncbi:MAG: repair protein RecN [Solirubrobacterales bacterium]|jgi:DNA repair protein RecN (Recombination protein N)|nr:repair protein RecN [Solirubrobacterales bacterium]